MTTDIHNSNQRGEDGQRDDADSVDSLSTIAPPSPRSEQVNPGPISTSTAPPVESQEPASESPVDGTADVPARFTIYTQWQKRLIVLAASAAMFFSPLTAQIYLPALNVLSQEFQVSSSKINLTVTTYMVFQGITPMFIGGLADTVGRRPAYIICFVIYICANIGLAVSNNYVSLLVVRCIQSAGSSTTVALCQAIVADIITSAERGQYIGITVIPVVVAPSLGPVIGGLLTQFLGWRAIFWFLTITSAVVFILILLFFPETCRALVGDGSTLPHPMYRTCWQMISDWRRNRAARAHRKADSATGRPAIQRTTTSTSTATTERPKFRLTPPNLLGSLQLLCTKELGLLLFYFGLLFAGFFAIATAIPSQVAAIYGFNDLQVGLVYLPMAGGSIVAAFIVGPGLDWNYRRHAARLGLPVDKTRQMDLRNFPIERARLEVALPLVLLSAAGMLSWGWALTARTSIAVPCVLLFVQGCGLIGVANAGNALIVDIYPGRAGAAVAANNLTRCLLGALFSAIILPMINAIGSGWAYTIIAGSYIVFLPILFVVMAKGIQWREEIRLSDEKKKAAREEKAQRQLELEGKKEESPIAKKAEDEKTEEADVANSHEGTDRVAEELPEKEEA